MREKDISVFVDESGSFDSSRSPSRYYIVTFVFHDTECPISDDVARLGQSLAEINLPQDHCIHTGPLIRREPPYHNMSREERRAVLSRMMAFVRNAPIQYHAFAVDKRFASEPRAMHDALLRSMVQFVISKLDVLDGCECLKVYYDNGQPQVKELLKETFAVLSSKTVFVDGVRPSDYRLFQAADFLCSMELIRTKLDEERHISESERAFFVSIQNLRKRFLKPLAAKRWL